MRNALILFGAAALCLALSSGGANALSAQCGNGCSSHPDADDHVHCTDWKPTNDVTNVGGGCQAIKLCVVGNCQTTIYTKGQLGFSSDASDGEQTGRQAHARVCVTGPANLVRVDTGRGTPSIDVSSFANPGGPAESMCCGSCNAGGTVCQNCALMSPMTVGCAGIIKSCPENTSEIIDPQGTGTCSRPNDG